MNGIVAAVACHVSQGSRGVDLRGPDPLGDASALRLTGSPNALGFLFTFSCASWFNGFSLRLLQSGGAAGGAGFPRGVRFMVVNLSLLLAGGPGGCVRAKCCYQISAQK